MNYPSSELAIDPVLLRRYDLPGARYTSYPTADHFVEAFGESGLRQWLAKRNTGGIGRPLSVYVQLCKRGIAVPYIHYLERELQLLPALLDSTNAVQLYLGGDTLSPAEMGEVMAALRERFHVAPDAECAIELDPRHAPAGTLEHLARLGFNRVSLGMQDFEPDLPRVVAEARANAVRSVNFDLIYGLPRQTLDGFRRTLERLIALDPDRIALYACAHLPERLKPPRRVAGPQLPSAETRLQMLTLAVGRLTRAGYLYIGMDHFARPDDELAIAQSQGRLRRNFQGYSAHAQSDLIALGVSAIGAIGPTYYQNHKRLDDYCASLDAGHLPVARGLELSADDLVRGAVIQALACQFRVSIESIEIAHLIDFPSYFARELKDLRRLRDEGLVEIGEDAISVTAAGRLLVRVVCRVFDRYLRETQAHAACARVI